MSVNFNELYREKAEAQKLRYDEIRKGYEKIFGDSRNAKFFSAPGRTEIGGNHTDHNHGRVLAAAVNLDIAGLAAKTDSGTVRLKSAEYTRTDTVDLDQLEKQPGELNSQALVRGILFKCRDMGYKIGGFNCYTMTEVLKGSGLSSSAAFEILVVTIISELYNDGAIDPVTKAIIAQYAENVYFEKPSGLLDQTASSVGGFTAIDFKNPPKPEIERIEFDFASCGHALCVVDTGGNHADLTGEYAAIPAEMKSAAKYFGKEVLREVDEDEFYASIAGLRRSVGDRAILRAMHFFDDNRLAGEEAKALKSGDFETFRKMVRASGRSSNERLQNVFATVSPNEQGISLALALAERFLGDRGAFRVHGGGFAGTIQAYVPFDMLEAFRSEIEGVFGSGSCYVLSVRPYGGVRVEL